MIVPDQHPFAPLAEFVSRQGWPSAEQSLQIVLRATRGIRSLHQQNVIHRRIGPESLCVNPLGEVEINDPPEFAEFGARTLDLQYCPPELQRNYSIVIPAQSAAAREVLHKAGLHVTPERIDVYQLTSLLCWLVTSGSVTGYLRSPQVKGQVASPIQAIIDRGLGYAEKTRFTRLDEFAEAVTKILETGSTDSENRPRLASDLPFDSLGHYSIVGRIGHGGMGDVYRGYESALNRDVAIKVLPVELARFPDFVQRFYAEASAAAKLAHPNIVPIHFIGEDQGHHFFAMQYIEGETLGALLARRTRLSPGETLQIVVQVLAGLGAAHDQGMVHRDVKPGNILLERKSQRALVVDFGLVKLLHGDQDVTVTGTVVGTVDFMSPEQARGQPVDARSDLYSLGVVMHRMLDGRLPFTGESATAAIFQHVYEPPPLLLDTVPDIPPSLAEIVLKLLQKSPAQRFQTAHEVIEALEEVDAWKRPTTFASQLLSPATQECQEDRRSSIVVAPRFEHVPPVASGTHEVSLFHWWTQFCARLRGSPDGQATCQNVDAALEEYQRRRDTLRQLIAEAESVCDDLRRSITANQQAANSFDQRTPVGSASNDDDSLWRGQAECQVAVSDLKSCLTEQTQQLESMQLTLSQVDAILVRLTSQRDVLVARLKVAQARKQLATAPLKGRPKLNRMTVLTVIAILVLPLIASRLWTTSNSRSENSDVVSEPPAESDVLPGQHHPLVYSHPKWQFWQKGEAGERVVPFRHEVTSIEFKQRDSDLVGYEFVVGDAEGYLTKFLVTVANNSAPGRIVGRHRSKINAAVYSPDGRSIAAGSNDKEMIVWHYQRGFYDARKIEGDVAPVRTIAFSPDGKYLLSVADEDTIRIWDVETGSELERLVLTQAQGSAACAAWTYDSKEFLLGGRNLLSLWRANQAIHRLEFQTSDTDTNKVALSAVGDLAYSATGTFAAAGKSIFVWELETGRKLKQFGQGIRLASFAPSTARALTVNRDGQLQLWDATTGSVISSHDITSHAASTLTLSEDGLKAITAGRDQTIRVWDLPKPPPPQGQLAEFQENTGVNAVAFGPAGNIAVSAHAEGATVWNVEQGKKVYEYELKSNILAVAISPTDDRLLYGTSQENSKANHLAIKAVHENPFETFKLHERVFQQFNGHTDAITAASYTPDGARVVSGSKDGTVRVWNARTGASLITINCASPVTCLAIDAQGRRALVGTQKKDAELWDLVDGSRIRPFTGHSLFVLGVAIAGSAPRAVTASADRTIRVWNLESGDAIATLSGHTRRVNSVAISRDGQFVLSGSDDGTVRYWNVQSSTELATFRGHSAPVRGVALSPDGRIAMSGGADCRIRFWTLP